MSTLLRRVRLSSWIRVAVVQSFLLACSSGGQQEMSAAPVPLARDTTTARTESAAESAPAPVAASPQAPAWLDTVRAGRFDNGKMWTFEYPPTEYFIETYGFAPDSSWLARARLGALRLPNCSASFVSPNGLVMTNHHCAREGVSEVSTSGETFLDDGFYASSVDSERRVESLHADQLIAILDVSGEVDAAMRGKIEDRERVEARDSATEAIAERLTEQYGGEEQGIVVETVALWNGAKHSAYVFKRYEDVRLVLAPELQIGYFGGDPDNFTYPRYALDMSFLRVYGEDGQPLKPENYFRWSTVGVTDGDPIFVIGNPGSTSRLQTVAELEFRRDVQDKATLALLDSRIEAMESYASESPDEAEAIDLRNTIFSLMNSQKAYRGMLAGLQDPYIMARRRDAEQNFKMAIERDPALRSEFGGIIDRMADIQSRKHGFAKEVAAFAGLGSPDLTAAVLLRAFFGFQYLSASSQGAPAETVEELRGSVLDVADQPTGLQRRLLAARLTDIQTNLSGDPMVGRLLGGKTPEQAAQDIVSGSVFSDSARTAEALAGGTLKSDDPAIQMLLAMLPKFASFQNAFAGLMDEEEGVANSVGRARFRVYGTTIPPDATFSLRVADGVVKGYEYNGTRAPVHTTFYGLYDRYYSNGGAGTDWDLPSRWLHPPSSFDLSTPLDFVTTADIIGGNSGSPVLNRNLEIVGLVFDGNIESLPGDYIYDDTHNRSVAVDARGILEALDEIYDADRIVLELTTGRLVRTEAEADAARR